MNKKLLLFGAGLLLTAATASAQKLVTGKVTDSHGEPVMGAAVRVHGTQLVTYTDAQGNFRLSGVPASAKRLNVSFIGMQPQTVSVAGNVNVILKDNELSEAVVVGYGTAQKLGTVVGSVKKVGGEVVADKPNVNIADALQGQVSGLQVFSNSGDVGDFNSVSIRLRGVGSLSASNTPLIVIDGSPASTAMFSMLNDKDIESITTLKDASATSIYGSRAANGVIFITTKRGTRDNAQVTVSQKVGWSQLAREIGNPMNANELLQFQLENGIISADQYAEYKAHGANTHWQDYFFDNAAPMYNTDFSIRGGSGTTSYYVSASYLQKDGLSKVSEFNRYTVRANLDAKPKDWLSFGLKQNVAYTDSKYNEWGNDYSSNANRASMGNVNVSAYMFAPYWDPYAEGYAEDHRIYGLGGTGYDPLWILQQRPSKNIDLVYNGVGFMQLQPVKGLTVKSQLGLYFADSRGSQYLTEDMPNVTELWRDESRSRSSMWTSTNTIEYKFSIAQKHNVTLLAGHEGIKATSDGIGVTGRGITDDRLNELSNATKADPPTSSYSKYEYLSFFGRADYGYDDKYFVNFTFRNDQSSRFGSKNRSANFLSGGVMWNVTREDFMSETRSWLTDLQLKASVGTTGNSEIGNYTSLGLMTTTQYQGVTGWVLQQPSNTDLGWEKQIQTNVGFSARLIDRVTVDLNYYNRLTKNMLMTMPLPYTTGFSSQMMNIGEMSNQGVELEVNYDVWRSPESFLTVYGNYAYNANEIKKLFYGLDEWVINGMLVAYKVGGSVNYYMPIYAGVDETDGAPMWYKKGYKGDPGYTYDPETMTKTFNENELAQDTGKKRFAPHSGGFGLSAGWKGITVAADFSYVLGKYMVNNDYLFAASSGNAKNGYNADRDMLNIWKKPGDHAELPSLKYDYQFDTHLLQNSSFLRLKNLTVSYDLPKAWMEASNFFTGVRFSFTGRNLLTVTKYKGADPERDSNLALGAFPSTREYVLGVDVTF